MIPINSAIESLLHQKKRRSALLLQLNLHALLQFIQLTSRESWVQNEVGGQIQPLTGIVTQTGRANVRAIGSPWSGRVNACAQTLDFLSDLLAGSRRGSFLQHGCREVREAGHICRIVERASPLQHQTHGDGWKT